MGELQRKLNSQTCTVSYTKVRAMIRKKWDLENWKRDICADSSEAGDFKPLNASEPSLPIESALPPLPKKAGLPLLEEMAMASPEVNTSQGSADLPLLSLIASSPIIRPKFQVPSQPFVDLPISSHSC